MNSHEEEDDDGWKLHRCAKCGERNLHWEEIDGKYRLVSRTGEIHSCQRLHRPAADEFPEG